MFLFSISDANMNLLIMYVAVPTALALAGVLSYVGLYLQAKGKQIIASLELNRVVMNRVEIKADKLHDLTNGGAVGIAAAALAASEAAEKLSVAREAAEQLVKAVALATDTTAKLSDVVAQVASLSSQIVVSANDQARLHDELRESQEDRTAIHTELKELQKDRASLHTKLDSLTCAVKP